MVWPSGVSSGYITSGPTTLKGTEGYTEMLKVVELTLEEQSLLKRGLRALRASGLLSPSYELAGKLVDRIIRHEVVIREKADGN